MQRIAREQARKYAFDRRDEALLRVKAGESFEIETYDASMGYFRTPEDLAVPAKRPGFTCPDFRINVYQMCRVGKLSYVAGAELPKRYLPGSTA